MGGRGKERCFVDVKCRKKTGGSQEKKTFPGQPVIGEKGELAKRRNEGNMQCRKSTPFLRLAAGPPADSAGKEDWLEEMWDL